MESIKRELEKMKKRGASPMEIHKFLWSNDFISEKHFYDAYLLWSKGVELELSLAYNRHHLLKEEILEREKEIQSYYDKTEEVKRAGLCSVVGRVMTSAE